MTRQYRREDELSLVSFYYLVFLFFCCFVLITPWPPYQNFIFSLTVVEADSGIQILSEGKIETHFDDELDDELVKPSLDPTATSGGYYVLLHNSKEACRDICPFW